MQPKLKFTGLDMRTDGGISARYEIVLDDESVGGFTVEQSPTGILTTDGMIGAAHRKMSGIVRQWAASLDSEAIAYEQRSSL